MIQLEYPEVKNAVVTEKLWGREEELVNGPWYCGKRLIVDRHSRSEKFKDHVVASSIHWHRDKRETFVVTEGILCVQVWPVKLGDSVNESEAPKILAVMREKLYCLARGQSLTLERGTPHRFWCSSQTPGDLPCAVFYEFSTQDDPKDSYRAAPSGLLPLELVNE